MMYFEDIKELKELSQNKVEVVFDVYINLLIKQKRY